MTSSAPVAGAGTEAESPGSPGSLAPVRTSNGYRYPASEVSDHWPMYSLPSAFSISTDTSFAVLEMSESLTLKIGLESRRL